MKHWMVIAAVGLAACAGSARQQAAPAASDPAHEAGGAAWEGLALLNSFLADPTHVAPAPVLVLVSERHDIEVRIPGDLMPALIAVEGVDEHSRALLLLGFVAGDARIQLARGVKGDDFTEGIRGLLQVYREMGLSVPELEAVAARERDGTIDAWAREWLAAHKAE